MTTLTIKVDDKDVKRMMADLRRNAPKYVSAAVNKTANADKTHVARALSRITGVPVTTIKKGSATKTFTDVGKTLFYIDGARPPTHRAKSVLMGRYYVAAYPPNYGKVDVNKKGVLRATLWKKRRVIHRAFVPKTSDRGVAFLQNKTRTGIRPVYGPNLGRERDRPEFQAWETRFLTQELRKQTLSQVDRLIKRRYR